MVSPRAESLLPGRPRRSTAALYLVALFCAAAVAWSYFTPVDVFISSPGVVRPRGEVVRITSQIAGRIQSVRRREGDRVATGDIIVQLDGADQNMKRQTLIQLIATREAELRNLARYRVTVQAVHDAERSRIQAEILSARDNMDRLRRELNAVLGAARVHLEQARNEYQSVSALLLEGLVSRQAWSASLTNLRLAELESARATADAPEGTSLAVLVSELEVAEARFASERADLEAASYPIEAALSQLRLQLDQVVRERERTQIRSPRRGQLTLLEPIHPGERLTPGDVIGTLETAPAIRVVEAIVDNRQAAGVYPGQRARLLLGQGRILEGTVDSISPDIRLHESGAGGYRVIVVPAEAGLRLGLGMEVRFRVRTETVLGLLVSRISRSLGKVGG